MRNAILLYPHIKNLTIEHGKAAEILGIHKYELINIYNQLGLAYLDQDMQEIDEEIQYWKKLKGKIHRCILIMTEWRKFKIKMLSQTMDLGLQKDAKTPSLRQSRSPGFTKGRISIIFVFGKIKGGGP